jgi:hypothetical protein
MREHPEPSLSPSLSKPKQGERLSKHALKTNKVSDPVPFFLYPSRRPASFKIVKRFLSRRYDVALRIKNIRKNITNHKKTTTLLLPRYLLDVDVRSRSIKAIMKNIK